MSLSGNQLRHFVGNAVAFIACGFISRWYLRPALKNQPSGVALPRSLLYAGFRVNGLMFLMSGLVSTQLLKAFANKFARRYIHNRQNVGKVVLRVA